MKHIKYLSFLVLLITFNCFAYSNSKDSEIVQNMCIESILDIDKTYSIKDVRQMCLEAEDFQDSYLNNIKKIYEKLNKDMDKNSYEYYSQINTLYKIKNEYDANKYNNIILRNNLNVLSYDIYEEIN